MNTAYMYNQLHGLEKKSCGTFVQIQVNHLSISSTNASCLLDATKIQILMMMLMSLAPSVTAGSHRTAVQRPFTGLRVRDVGLWDHSYYAYGTNMAHLQYICQECMLLCT